MSKPLLLEFYDRSIPPPQDGLKHVLFQLFKDDKMIGFDWGYAESKDGKFDNLVQDGVTAQVVKWCRMPNPQLVL